MRGVKWAGAVAGAAGLVAGAVLAAPSGASAADGQALILGQTNTSTNPTVIDTKAWWSLWATGGVEAARALIGDPNFEDDEPMHEHVMWVRATDRGGALFTNTYYGAALVARGGNGHAAGFAGVGGTDGGPALSVDQASPGGRGASFSGPAAQVQLRPAAGSHPKSGQKGDLFVDKDGKLWFCKGGTSWKQLA